MSFVSIIRINIKIIKKFRRVYLKSSHLIKNFFINIKKPNNSILPITMKNIMEIFEVMFIPEK